jgi:transcriptional regulator with XRE-family HTH domain
MKRLARERQRKGLTQATAALRVGIGASSYFKIEQGVLIPGKDSGTAHKLERFFGYRLKTLLAEAP